LFPETALLESHPGLLAQLFRFLSQASSLPNFDPRKFVAKKENSKMEKEGFANKFTIDVRPQLDNYIRSSARFFRRCCVFFTRIVPFMSFIREHLQAVALVLYNFFPNAANKSPDSIYSPSQLRRKTL